MSGRKHIPSQTQLSRLPTPQRIDWETPKRLFASLDEEFKFTLDPCCTKKTAKCAKYYTPEDDGLSKSWKGERVYLNPPYGRYISEWIEKSYRETRYDCPIVVGLLPARSTDTKWWHDYIIPYAEIRFIRRRLKFVGGQSAPFASCIVIWGEGARLGRMYPYKFLDGQTKLGAFV